MKNIENMIRKHDHQRNKKTTVFKLKDLISVKIQRIDTCSAGAEFLSKKS